MLNSILHHLFQLVSCKGKELRQTVHYQGGLVRLVRPTVEVLGLNAQAEGSEVLQNPL